MQFVNGLQFNVGLYAVAVAAAIKPIVWQLTAT